MACLPITDSASVGSPYYSSGGGGGVNPLGISTNAIAPASGNKITLGNNTTNISVDLAGSTIQVTAPNGLVVNGVAPFVSTFLLPLPANTSTLLMELPPGQYGYNGVNLYTGSLTVLQGFANCLADTGNQSFYGSLIANSNSQPASTNPNSEMTLNFGDNPLSTIKLICANNSSQSGLWVGGVGKLY